MSPVTVLQGICDGAGAVVLASEAAVKEHSLTPLARLVGYAVAGVEPTIMGIGPAPAIRKLLEKSGLSLNDIALVEVGTGSRYVTHLTLYACFTFVFWQCFFTVLITIFFALGNDSLQDADTASSIIITIYAYVCGIRCHSTQYLQYNSYTNQLTIWSRLNDQVRSLQNFISSARRFIDCTGVLF